MFKVIYKRQNISSFQEIREFQKKNNINKIGHSGTLDLLAQGLLLIATDDDTKLLPYLKNKDKEYKVKAKLGFVSKTYDAEGPIEFCSNKIPTECEVKSIIDSFKGKIEQLPPIFSAKKINGKKAYELARKNQQIKLNKIEVTIYDIKNICYNYPFLEFDVSASNGTYIRTLIHDIGQKLNVGAYITFLERTKVNGLSIGQEINTVDLLTLKKFIIDSKQTLTDFFNGKKTKINLENNNYLLIYNDEPIGIIEVENSIVKKQKLFGKKILNFLNKE